MFLAELILAIFGVILCSAGALYPTPIQISADINTENLVNSIFSFTNGNFAARISINRALLHAPSLMLSSGYVVLTTVSLLFCVRDSHWSDVEMLPWHCFIAMGNALSAAVSLVLPTPIAHQQEATTTSEDLKKFATIIITDYHHLHWTKSIGWLCHISSWIVVAGCVLRILGYLRLRKIMQYCKHLPKYFKLICSNVYSLLSLSSTILLVGVGISLCDQSGWYFIFRITLMMSCLTDAMGIIWMFLAIHWCFIKNCYPVSSNSEIHYHPLGHMEGGYDI